MTTPLPESDTVLRSEDVMPTRIKYGRSVTRAMAFGAILLLAAPLPALAANAPQTSFASPEAAVDALVAAASADRVGTLVRLLGPGSSKLVESGDPVADHDGRARFVAAYKQQYVIEKTGDDKATLVVGDDHWALPIAIVRQGKRWHFDAKSAEQEILARRIGRNELSAIGVCGAYVEAQREYASKDRNGDGVLEYAQKFRSTKGKHDGLYWETKPGEPESPVGPLVTAAHAEGYKVQPYHGYYYRILTAQGKDAPGGAYSYVALGRMIGGFALVAWPAEYGKTGVKTFLINQLDVLSPQQARECGEDLRRLLDAEGLADTPLLGVSARTGLGLAELRDWLMETVTRNRTVGDRIAADIDALVDGFAEHSGPRLAADPALSAAAAAGPLAAPLPDSNSLPPILSPSCRIL